MKYINKFNLILIKFLLYLLCCYYLLLYIITDVKCFDWRKIFFISILTLFLKLQQITTNPTLTSYLELTLKWPWNDLELTWRSILTWKSVHVMEMTKEIGVVVKFAAIQHLHLKLKCQFKQIDLEGWDILQHQSQTKKSAIANAKEMTI